MNYKAAIEGEFDIVNKRSEDIPFTLNKAQEDFVSNMTGRDIILKARQLGFSSLILAILTIDFILEDNQRCVVMSHETDATQRLMDRVKFYVNCFERKNNTKLNLRYNSRSEMVNEGNGSSFYIGTAESRSFGRGDTITSLHLSEFAFYPDPEKILAGVMQAVIPTGKVFIESTANGFNFFKGFWDEAKNGNRPFKAHFYNPTWEYDEVFLANKKAELGRFYEQEYPMTDSEAFLTSGNLYFDSESLKWYLDNAKDPISKREDLVYI